MAKIGLRFKKEKRETGLAGIGHNPSTVIKINGLEVGMIHAPQWNSKTDNYTVSFMVMKDNPATSSNPNCDWSWKTFKQEFETEDLAREFVKNNLERIFSMWKFHSFNE